MRSVTVQSVRVDDQGRIRVRPELANERGLIYPFIYRAAAWVRWDSETNEFYVTPEKVEDLEGQFARISKVLLGECGETLKLTSATDFTNVPQEVVDRLALDLE